MSQVRISQVELEWFLEDQPRVQVARLELVSGSLPPIRFRLDPDGHWRPDETIAL